MFKFIFAVIFLIAFVPPFVGWIVSQGPLLVIVAVVLGFVIIPPMLKGSTKSEDQAA
jgi:hypothetical protein